MGSFPVTCPMSGIPIERETKVKWSMILPCPLQSTCYPTGQYQFLLPFMDGIYNDYGFVEKIKPDWYSSHIEQNIMSEYEIDPKDLINNDDGALKIWMVRKDVFDFIVKKTPLSDKLKKQVECYLDSYDVDKGWPDSDGFRKVSCPDDGFLHMDARKLTNEMLTSNDVNILKDFSNRLLQSVRFMIALKLICKAIQPIQTVTPIFDAKPYDDIIDFNRFVTEKMLEIKYEYLADR